MEADLNLAQTLGGLRIANPDDNPSPASSRGGSTAPKPSSSPMFQPPAPSGAERARSPLATPSLPTNDILRTSSPLDFNPRAFSTESILAGRRPSPIEKPVSPRFGSPKPKDQPQKSSSYSSRQSMPLTYQDQQQSQFPQYPTMVPLAQRSSSSAMRPVSAMYTQPVMANGDQMRAEPPLRLEKETSRSSMYGIPQLHRSSSRGAAMAMQAGVPIQEGSHTERTYRQAPMGQPNGMPPPRKSSRNMSSTPSSKNASTVGATNGHEPGPSHSSEDWKDRGAAVGVRREVDASGNQILKHVKKGVKDFKFGRTLGEGSYSTVIAATDRQTGKEYAIKVLDKRHIIKEKKVKYVNIEKDTLNLLTDHPGVVRLYYTFQDEQSLYFVLDLASSGELLGVLKRTTTFDEECTRFYAAEILDTVAYMHSKDVIHRDLKPENVLLNDKMHVKITDFGTAKILRMPTQTPNHGDGLAPPTGNPMEGAEDNRANSFVGTAEYVSPELLTDKKAFKASDLWAFGCIVYQLLAGRPPFKAGNEYLTFQKIVALDYKFPPGFPEVAKDLVERLLVLDPASRLSIEHIKNHEFFDGINWGRGLWRTPAPQLKPFNPAVSGSRKASAQMDGAMFPPNIAPSHSTSEKRFETPGTNISRPNPRIITELPPPSQLDIEWSPVLTNINERILKLGNLLVNATPGPHSPNSKNGLQNGDLDTPRKLSRLFGGGNTAKKRQRLVMVTSSARIIIVAAGGEDKKSKIEIDVKGADCSWNKMQDPKGLSYWCVDTPDKHYTFEPGPASSSGSGSSSNNDTGSATSASAQEWLDAIDRARDLAHTQSQLSLQPTDSNTLQDIQASRSGSRQLDLDSPGPAMQPDYITSGLGRGDRHRLEKQVPGIGSTGEGREGGGGGGGGESWMGGGRKRFSKRQSKSGLAAVF